MVNVFLLLLWSPAAQLYTRAVAHAISRSQKLGTPIKLDVACVAGVPKGRGRELGGETAREGGGRRCLKFWQNGKILDLGIVKK